MLKKFFGLLAVALKTTEQFGQRFDNRNFVTAFNCQKFFGLLALIFVLNFSVVNAAQVASVTDKCKLLSAQEIDSLNQKIRQVEQAHKIKIGIAFVKSVGNRDLISVADEMRDKYFANSKNGSIVLLVDMNQRKYEIATNPTMQTKITNDDGIYFLKDSFQSSLRNEDYYGACNNFIDGVEELVTYYETNGTPYTELAATGGIDPMAAGLAVVLAIFCGVFIRSVLISSMSNVRHAMEAIDYLKKNTVKITESRDMFLFRNVKRRPKSGGGGRRGGGSGHSGGGGGGGSF